jgi:hypothetical protein
MSRHAGTLAVAALGAGLAAVPTLNSSFLVWNASGARPNRERASGRRRASDGRWSGGHTLKAWTSARPLPRRKSCEARRCRQMGRSAGALGMQTHA